MFIEITQIVKSKDFLDHVEKFKTILNTDTIGSVIYLDGTELPAKSEIILKNNTFIQVEETYEVLKSWLCK